MALRLSQGNAPEMLTLARQFPVGQFWYGQRGPEGPAYYELVNLLGDQRRSPRSLERGRPPPALGSMGLEFLRAGEGGATAMQISYQGRSVLIMPPGRKLQGATPGSPSRVPLSRADYPRGPGPGPTAARAATGDPGGLRFLQGLPAA